MTKEEQAQQLAKLGISPTKKFNTTFADIDSFGDAASMAAVRQNIGKYQAMLNERITLINDSLTADIPFTRENLYLFCAFTGNGKSTIAANITFPLWKQKKKVLVISNEETDQDILMRIAALDREYDFNAYKKGTMPPEQIKECTDLFEDIAEYVKIKDVTWEQGGTTYLEGVQGLLDNVIGAGYSCVLIDYFQLIKNTTANNKNQSTYDVLNNFRIWLGLFIKRCELPVCLFVQLHSIGKRGEALDARIKHCPDIVEPATVIIEAIPNFDDRTTAFLIAKDRFGKTGTKIICPFKKGRFLKQESVRSQAELNLAELEEEIKANDR